MVRYCFPRLQFPSLAAHLIEEERARHLRDAKYFLALPTKGEAIAISARLKCPGLFQTRHAEISYAFSLRGELTLDRLFKRELRVKP